MSAVIVRDARLDDAEALVPLLATLGYPAEPDLIRARMSDLLRADPTGRLLVASVDGRLSGFAALHVTPVLHRSTGVGRITALAVLPSSQRVGVGRRLLETSEQHFAALGLERIEVTSGRSHERAYAFYRRLGYEDHGVRFAKEMS
jgi:ribosomal protein S18 acetylase RimI-like enzyme